jgi:hypothetical protein
VRAHLLPIVGLLLFNVVVITLGIYAGERLAGDWWFMERGLLDIVTATQFLLAALAALLAFHYFWKYSEHQGPDVAGIFLWALAALGLVIFAIDDYFGTHESVGEQLAEWFIDAENVINGLVFSMYVIVAAAVLYLFRHELLTRRSSSLLLWLAVVASALAAGSAGLNDIGADVPAALSNPALAAGLWLAAATVRLQEVLAARRSSGS